MHRDRPYRKPAKHPRKPPYTSKEYQLFRRYLRAKYLGPLLEEDIFNAANRPGFARRILNPTTPSPPLKMDVRKAFIAECVPYNHRLRYAHLVPADFNDPDY